MMAQSKLWFNDGLWWGVLFDRSSEEYHIYRYEWAPHSWNDTGTLVDERNFSKADALWDGNHLYAVSAGPNSTNSAHSARVSRYSYNAATRSYALDPRFPVTVTNSGMKTIVLDKDTTDKLWVTYTKNNHVYVNRSLSDQQTWGTPFVLPVMDSAVSSDDISAVVAFGSLIGVMWSNQLDDAMYFATHTDGEDDEVWQESRTAMATNASTGEGSDTFLGVENLLGSSKADTLTGSATNNKLTGRGGPDTEQGGSGNDTLLGSGGDDEVNSKDGVNGNDSLDGRAGTDTKVTDTTEKSIVNFP